MRIQKSPHPYTLVLLLIIAIAIYFNFTIDKEINNPITLKVKSKVAPTTTKSDGSPLKLNY